MKKIVLPLLLFVSFCFAQVTIELSHKQVKHGTSFAVVFQSDAPMSQAPNAIFLDKTYQMFTIGGDITQYVVFLPVDYHTPLKKYDVVVTYLKNTEIEQQKDFIEVVDGQYKQNEIIKVPRGKVTLSTKNKQRAKKEYSKVYSKVYSQVYPHDLTQSSFFQNPMESKITSAFGNARVYNGVAKSYHTGTDFRAAIGDDIFASNYGKVALVMDRFYLGRVIYIDHGRGAYSYYSHLSESLVKEGDIVNKGQLIAKSGDTGRVTGPHLHYAMRLYNTTVDPLQYHKLYNTIVKKYN